LSSRPTSRGPSAPDARPAECCSITEFDLSNGSGPEQASPRALAPLLQQARQGLKFVVMTGTVRISAVQSKLTFQIGGQGVEALYGGVVESISLLDMRVGKGAERQADEITFEHLRSLHRLPRLQSLRVRSCSPSMR